MTATNQNVELFEGESKVLDISQTDTDDGTGTVDFSGYQELRWYVTRAQETVVVEKTDSGSSDVSITDVSVGAYEITIQPQDTDGLVEGRKEQREFEHFVTLTDSSGNVSVLLEGTFTVKNN